MFVRAGDATITTDEWFRLNTDSMGMDLLVGEDRERMERLTEIRPDNGGLEIPDWHVEPDETRDSGDNGIRLFEEPDPDAYEPSMEQLAAGLGGEDTEEYQADLAAWRTYDEAAREKLSGLESEDTLPMWGTLFGIEDHDIIRDACFAVGLRLFEHEDVSGLLIGVDSAGHSFYESYWIPLRARLARGQLSYASPADRDAFVMLLASEWSRQGHGKVEACAEEVRKIAGLDKIADANQADADAS